MCGIAGFCNFKEDFEENTDYWNFRLERCVLCSPTAATMPEDATLKSILVCRTAVGHP